MLLIRSAFTFQRAVAYTEYSAVCIDIILFSRWNRWTRPDIAPESGMANVVVGIPTGYVISRDTVEWMYSANFTGLQRIRFNDQKLIMFFSHVSLSHLVTSPVASIARVWGLPNKVKNDSCHSNESVLDFTLS